MNVRQILAISGITAALVFSASAQQDQGGGRQRGGGNFDPAQMRERILERYKETLEVTDDNEWKAIQPLVQKVWESRMQQMSGMGRGMMGPRRGGGDGGPGGPGAPGGAGGGQGGRGGGGFFGQSNPAADALQKAVDAKASKAELKAAVAKYNEARKAKQAELETAQENLRKVLTARQEALATLNGLL